MAAPKNKDERRTSDLVNGFESEDFTMAVSELTARQPKRETDI